MKKFVIGLGVLAVFALYSLGLRNQAPKISKPSSLKSNPTPSASTNQSSNQAQGSTSGAGSSSTSTTNQTSTTSYKDGTYTGSVEDAYYGNVQVQVVISGGKLTNVKVLQYPNTHSTSVMINQQAIPYLKQEAIAAQNTNVQIISGATFTSQAFVQSLSNALAQA